MARWGFFQAGIHGDQDGQQLKTALQVPAVPQPTSASSHSEHGTEVLGFHIDDETCSGLDYNNATEQRIVCANFFDKLANLTSTYAAASTSLPRPLTLAVDAGTGWVCPQPTCSPPYCGCINITWGGATKSVASHVVDIASETVLMDYDRDAQSLYSRALPYLTYADTSPNASTIRVGVAISEPCVAGTPCNPASWQTRSEAEMAALMAKALPQLQTHRSFAGFAVFHGGTWYAQALANPAPKGTVWPANVASWYIDHAMIVNETNGYAERTAWLQWAASRHMTEVYVAPHATNIGLIVIPGVSGSVENQQKFCTFIGLAAQQGLGVRLSAGTAVDLDFVRNCTNTPEIP